MNTKTLESDFSPIRVSTLRGDIKIPFDAFVRVAGKHILYCRKGDSFEGLRLDRLKSKKLRQMFIRSEDAMSYQQYLDASIEAAYDSSRPLPVRAEIIQGFQQAAAEHCMDEPLDQMAYVQARSSIQRFVQFLQEEPEGAKSLLEIENTDQSITQHCVNVAVLSTMMALSDAATKTLPIPYMALGALIHDIEHYRQNQIDLSLPLEDLPPAEQEVYKRHPLEGLRHFQGTTFVDQLVFDVISKHEENAIGTGFPKGLREEDLDPLILIVGCANAMDRLVSFEGKSHKDALKQLLIDKMGAYPLSLLQVLQNVIKSMGMT